MGRSCFATFVAVTGTFALAGAGEGGCCATPYPAASSKAAAAAIIGRKNWRRGMGTLPASAATSRRPSVDVSGAPALDGHERVRFAEQSATSKVARPTDGGRRRVEAWAPFFQGELSAAAALAGLLFVS